MPIAVAKEHTARCDDLLGRVFSGVERQPANCWTLRLPGCGSGEAHLIAGWLLLVAALTQKPLRMRRSEEHRVIALLTRTAGLPGHAKLALNVDGHPQVRAEVPVDGDLDEDEIIAAGEGLTRGASCYRIQERSCSPGDQDAARDAARVATAASDTDCDVAGLCQQAGWPFVRRSDDRLAIELDVPRGFHQALAEPCADGVRLTVSLGSDQACTPLCRRAIGLLLLTVNSSVRYARAVAEASDDRFAAQLEVSLTRKCLTADRLAHALSALSMACRICSREVEALEHETVARAYLAARGWSSPAFCTSKMREEQAISRAAEQ